MSKEYWLHETTSSKQGPKYIWKTDSRDSKVVWVPVYYKESSNSDWQRINEDGEAWDVTPLTSFPESEFKMLDSLDLFAIIL